MARPRKSTTPTTVTIMNTNETVNISDYCKTHQLSEQAFRLALGDIRPDDFDSVKAVPSSEASAVHAALKQATLPAPNNSHQIAGNHTEQAIEPVVADSTNNNDFKMPEISTQQGIQPDSAIVANSGNVGMSQKPQAGQPSNITLLDELIAASEEEIKLADLVAQFKSQQILQNAAARDAQLVDQLRHQRLNTRAGYFDALRGLQSTTIDRLEIAPDDLDFDAEVTRLSNELGKQLTINV
jgi:hypothetical protein